MAHLEPVTDLEAFFRKKSLFVLTDRVIEYMPFNREYSGPVSVGTGAWVYPRFTFVCPTDQLEEAYVLVAALPPHGFIVYSRIRCEAEIQLDGERFWFVKLVDAVRCLRSLRSVPNPGCVTVTGVRLSSSRPWLYPLVALCFRVLMMGQIQPKLGYRFDSLASANRYIRFFRGKSYCFRLGDVDAGEMHLLAKLLDRCARKKCEISVIRNRWPMVTKKVGGDRFDLGWFNLKMSSSLFPASRDYKRIEGFLSETSPKDIGAVRFEDGAYPHWKSRMFSKKRNFMDVSWIGLEAEEMGSEEADWEQLSLYELHMEPRRSPWYSIFFEW